MLIPNKNAIGIFGGSFDPPHKGHVEISKISKKRLKLKNIYWVITKKNPFKSKTFFSLKERIKKSKKILKKVRNIDILYLDDKVGSSRMINIVHYFKKNKLNKDLYLILGSDNLISFHKWKSWKKIVKLTKLVVFSRKGYDKKSKESIIVKYLNKKNIIFVKNKLINVSSTSIKRHYLDKFK